MRRWGGGTHTWRRATEPVRATARMVWGRIMDCIVKAEGLLERTTDSGCCLALRLQAAVKPVGAPFSY